MFRPVPELTLFRLVPVRLIAAVLLILACAVSVLLLVSLEHERLIVHGLTAGRPLARELLPALSRSRTELIQVTGLLFLVSAIGIAAVVTFVHYQNARRMLEEVKGLARNILESIPTGVMTVSRAGVITAVNPRAEAVLRRTSQALLGQPYASLFAEGDPIRTVLDRALAGAPHVDHQDVPYDDGGGARTIRVSTADLTGDDREPAGVILLAKDVTDWLALEQRVRGAEKLAALHTLSAGVAHELRNPLSAVDLNLHLLEDELRDRGPRSPKAEQYLQVLNAEIRRLSAILDNFMRFARPGSIRPHHVDTTHLLSHIATLLRYEAEERKIRLVTRVAEGMPPLVGDETQISQVLVNIVVNAFQAMPDGGVCEIAAAGAQADAGDWVEIAVRDTGIGIKSDELSRLFEPFYTTKTGGSGLGLAIAYRIVEDHGGTIQVSSTPGGGTTVVVRFPAAAAGQGAVAVGSS